MFIIIRPRHHRKYRYLIYPFLKELNNRSSALSHEFLKIRDAVFVLAQEDPDRINGGAVFFQRDIDSLHPKLKEQLASSLKDIEKIWIGTIALELKPGIVGQDFECFSKIFYENLFETFLKFGSKENISFLCLTLPPCEHIITDLMECWPYVIKVHPKESEDGLYHNILALKDTHERFYDSPSYHCLVTNPHLDKTTLKELAV